MVTIKKQILTPLFNKAKIAIKTGERDKARDLLDMGIAYSAKQKEEGMKGEDLIEGYPINLWLERNWQMLENHNLLL